MTTKKSAKRAAVYVRISQDRNGAGLGVKRQRQDCEKLATSLGYVVADVYEDNDKSAYSGKPRPSYVRLLDDLRAGRVDAVICWHPDRLHRAPIELETYIGVCDPHSIPTHSVKSGEYDLSTATGRMTARIVGAVARGESEHKAERIARKHEQSAKAGTWRGGIRPFGYLPGGTSVLVTHDDEARELRRMTSAVLAGESLAALTRDLNARGVTTTTGGQWSYSTLREVLLRPRNAGLSEYRGEVVGSGQWEALVSEDEWRAVCSVLRNPSRRRSTSNVAKHLLTGIVRCGVCGATMKTAGVDARNGKRRTIYRCHVYPAANDIDGKVVLVVLGMLDGAKVHTMTGDGTAEDVKRTNKATTLRARLDALTVDFADGLIDRAAMRAGTQRIREQLDAIERESVTRNKSRALDGLGGNVLTWWQGLSLARKRAVIELLMTVTVTPRGRGKKPLVNIEPHTDVVSIDSDRPGFSASELIPSQSQSETLRSWAEVDTAIPA